MLMGRAWEKSRLTSRITELTQNRPAGPKNRARRPITPPGLVRDCRQAEQTRAQQREEAQAVKGLAEALGVTSARVRQVPKDLVAAGAIRVRTPRAGTTITLLAGGRA